MNGMKKLIVTTIREYLNENKITPDYLKINKPYIDKDGYIQTIKANPEDILVDMTLIPNWRDLDIIDEVIVITND